MPYKSPLELSLAPARGHAELSVGARARTDDSREGAGMSAAIHQLLPAKNDAQLLELASFIFLNPNINVS